MENYFERDENGVKVTIKEGYQFPHGTIYKGEVTKDGKVVFGVQSAKDYNDCKERLCKAIGEKVTAYRKEASLLNKMKKLVEVSGDGKV